jgi:hypothetical protein
MYTYASIFLRIPFFRPNRVQPDRFISHARARIHRFSSPPPRGRASSRIRCTSNRSSFDYNFFQKLLPLETEASILCRLVISPPPNCSPPPLLTYKMVASAMAPQDGSIPPIVHHPPGSFRRNEEHCIPSAPKIAAG